MDWFGSSCYPQVAKIDFSSGNLPPRSSCMEEEEEEADLRSRPFSIPRRRVRRPQ